MPIYPEGPVVLKVICAVAMPLAAGFTVVGLIEHVGGSRPVACTEQVSETGLAKPFIDPKVIVETPLCPGLRGFGDEAETEKSGDIKLAVTDWSPFMVTTQLVVP